MRTNRTTLAVMSSIALAVVAGPVAAQSTDEAPATPSYWTCTQTEGPSFAVDGPIGVIPGGYRTTVGLTYTGEADDPRAAGDGAVALVYDYTGITGNPIARGIGVSRLVNAGGSWEGTIHALSYPDGSAFRMAMMEGQDGYEGLALTMTNFISPSGDEQCQGLIWEVEAPPPPDVSALPA
jgi:hypothetical protein